MKQNQPAAEKNKIFTFCTLAFSVLLWAVLSDAWGYSENMRLPDEWNTYIYGYISRTIWVLPFLLLIIKHKSKYPVFTLHFNWKPLFIAITACTAYIFGGMLVNHGGWWVNPDVFSRNYGLVQTLLKYMLVGFVEETVYRGFGLVRLAEFMGPRAANAASALFFTAVHIPAYFIHWYRLGTLNLPAMLAQAGTAFVLGIIFGIIFTKSKSLWPPIILHFWYDLESVLFIG